MSATVTKPTTTTINLASVVHASEEAAREAAAAQSKALALAAKADEARQRADEEQKQAHRRYLDQLTSEHPAARERTMASVGETRTALESVVRGQGGDLIPAYVSWVDAMIHAWEVTEELDRMRRFHGQTTRYQSEPAFDFGIDVGAIVNKIAMELHQDAIDRIDERRVTYLRGETK